MLADLDTAHLKCVVANQIAYNRHPMNSDLSLLQGVKIVSLALNAPGPVAAARLTRMGAEVTKIEPPSGDATIAAGPNVPMSALPPGREVERVVPRRSNPALPADPIASRGSATISAVATAGANGALKPARSRGAG